MGDMKVTIEGHSWSYMSGNVDMPYKVPVTPFEEVCDEMIDVVDLFYQTWKGRRGERKWPITGEWTSFKVTHTVTGEVLMHLMYDLGGGRWKWMAVGPTPWPVDRVIAKFKKGEVSHAD